MKYISVKNADFPALGLGTFTLKGPEAVGLFDHALGVGYRHIDTAQFYDNEEEVGKAIRQSSVLRDHIFLTTKVWHDRLSRKHFLPSVEESLRKLKTPYVDLLLIHWPSQDVPLEESLAELMKAQDRGYARHIGVSNFPSALIRQTLEFGAPIIGNQVEYHPFLDQSRVLEELAKADLMLTAYSPIAQGKVLQDPTMVEIARAHGKTPTQVSLRWLMQQDQVAAIPRSSKPERITENLNIFDFELSEEDMRAIHHLRNQNQRLVKPSFAPAWD